MSDYNDAMCITELRKEIERMQFRHDEYKRLSNEMTANMQKRIEELEKIVANYHGSEKLMGWMRGDGHHITDEQIDAAVASAEHILKGCNDEIDCHWLAWDILNKLNIHRCEGCGGEEPSMEWGEGALLCSKCNGHGWTHA